MSEKKLEQEPKPVNEFSIEEFSITELEERLELLGRCNNCKPD